VNDIVNSAEYALAIYLAKLKKDHTDLEVADIFINSKRTLQSDYEEHTKCIRDGHHIS